MSVDSALSSVQSCGEAGLLIASHTHFSSAVIAEGEHLCFFIVCVSQPTWVNGSIK